MGTLKMMHMKQCKGKNKARHLQNAINYIFNPEKYSQRWMGGNVGSTPTEVFDNMMRLKKIYGKENGRQGYHYVLTFKPGEVDEELACRITQEFCDLFFQEEYQHVFVLHNDRKHMHTHIIFNSIDMNGKKYHYQEGDWKKEIQPLVNSLCKKYGLSEINLEKEKEEQKQQSQEKSEKQNKKTSESNKKEQKKSSGFQAGPDSKSKKNKWKEERKNLYKQIKSDINAAILEAENFEKFLRIMEHKGYRIRIGKSEKHVEYITFTPQNRRGVRSYTLGEGYSLKDIKYQIENKDILNLTDESFQKDIWGEKYKRIYLHSPENLKRLYLKNTYLVRNWKGERLRMYPQMQKYRKSLDEIKNMEEECYYISEFHINGLDEIDAKLEYIDYKLRDLGRERYQIVNAANTAGGEMPVEDQEKLQEITEKFRRYMKEKNVLQRIKKRFGQMWKQEKDIEKAQQERDQGRTYDERSNKTEKKKR